VLVADLDRIGRRATNVQHQPALTSRRECSFVRADAGGDDRTAVVLRVGLIEVATSMALNVGCTGRRSHAATERKARRMLGEEGSHDSVSTTGDELCLVRGSRFDAQRATQTSEWLGGARMFNDGPSESRPPLCISFIWWPLWSQAVCAGP
jgi:hypothetical protein